MSPELTEVFKEYDMFITNTVSVVSTMNSTFERKRNSVAQQRRSNKKTGLIDASRLAEYKFSEDLFKKRTLVSNQKSHSVYVLLDWSGSVSGSILPMVKQAINLARFCYKAKIHFRICAFTSGAALLRNDANITKEAFMNIDKAKNNPLSMFGFVDLLEFVSSDTPRSEFDNACKFLYLVGYLNSPKNKVIKGYNSSLKVPETYELLRGLALNGTPLNASLIQMKGIIDNDTQLKKIQNPNLIVITDGMSEGIHLSNQNGVASNDHEAFRTKSIFLDPKTNKQYKFEDYKYVYKNYTAHYRQVNTTSLLIDWIRDSGISCFQMYLENATPHKMVKSFIDHYSMYASGNDFKDIDMSVKSLKRKVDSKQIGCLENFVSYDKAFFVNPATAFGEEMAAMYCEEDYDEDGNPKENNKLDIDLDKAKTAKQIGKAFNSAMFSVANQKLVGELIVTEICEKI